jgi:hypothetical protein
MNITSPGQSFQATGGLAAVSTVALRAANATTTESVYITDIIITIYAYADTGTIALQDGTTTYFQWLCKDGNGSSIHIHFNKPFYWGQNKAINLINATANVSCRAVVLGYTNIKAA